MIVGVHKYMSCYQNAVALDMFDYTNLRIMDNLFGQQYSFSSAQPANLLTKKMFDPDDVIPRVLSEVPSVSQKCWTVN